MAQEEDKSQQKNGKKETKQQSSEQVDELAETKDRLLRLAAEFDNYKKRSAKETDAAKGIGKAELAKLLLPALDEFELALSAIPKVMQDNDHVKGVELVYSNILSSLKSAGLKEIDSRGRYDPYRHEIIMTKESKEPEGTIIEVVRKGYTFNDMLLRPSSVIVSKGNASKEIEQEGE
ncbi:MAG: nucleotide exchange factor GrpE [Candidatus Micrarchaeota archaeon]|nr:nucleotide exchange factor GrpE [Candidatus Micrarchaeota archaeon]